VLDLIYFTIVYAYLVSAICVLQLVCYFDIVSVF